MLHQTILPPAHDLAAQLLAESRAYPIGSLDRDYRRRAAWKLDQMNRGIPACDWTDEPPMACAKGEAQ